MAKNDLALLNGQKWRATHQKTIDAVLGARVRSVTSQGSGFFNVDDWVARSFAAALCEWADLNPGLTPSQRDVEGWVAKANRPSNVRKGITIAQTPDDLPRGLALALVGGGYHEAWHTLYSRTKALSVREVWPHIQRLWPLVPYDPKNNLHSWKGLTGAILTWSNIIEDIRIERIGCVEFPGALSRMEELQDLILRQEIEGRTVSAHRGLPQNEDLSTVMGTFRDLGLGYKTPTQGLAIEGYKTRAPKAFAVVVAGPLQDMLVRSIGLGINEDMESLWIAMEVVAQIVKMAKHAPPPPPPPPSEGEGEEGDGEGQAGPADPNAPKGKGGKAPKGRVWKVGERAKLKVGAYAGREVEVTLAGLPDSEGKQELEFSLVEGEAA